MLYKILTKKIARKENSIILREVSKLGDEAKTQYEVLSYNKEKIVAVLESLASIAQQQSAATQEVTASMEEQLSSTEEIASSSEHLAQMSEDLNKDISVFKFYPIEISPFGSVTT